MRLFRIAGYLVASALMLASPAAIAAPVFDNDTEFIVQNPEQRLDLATNHNISVAASQNTPHSTSISIESSASPRLRISRLPPP